MWVVSLKLFWWQLLFLENWDNPSEHWCSLCVAFSLQYSAWVSDTTTRWSQKREFSNPTGSGFIIKGIVLHLGNTLTVFAVLLRVRWWDQQSCKVGGAAGPKRVFPHSVFPFQIFLWTISPMWTQRWTGLNTTIAIRLSCRCPRQTAPWGLYFVIYLFTRGRAH